MMLSIFRRRLKPEPLAPWERNPVVTGRTPEQAAQVALIAFREGLTDRDRAAIREVIEEQEAEPQGRPFEGVAYQRGKPITPGRWLALLRALPPAAAEAVKAAVRDGRA